MSGTAQDTLSRLNGLFTQAVLALAQAGEADAACRLAARGYALLRHDHEHDARRLDATLHRLVRLLPKAHAPQAGGKLV